MAKRTTIILDDDIYERLVDESLKRHKTTKAVSKVANELLRSAFKDESAILRLVLSKKIVRTSAKDFEKSRRMLSKRLES